MIKYICSICGREVSKIIEGENAVVKTDVPLSGALQYNHTLKNVDKCEDCATRITMAGHLGEVWEYYLIRHEAGKAVPIECLPPECRAQAMLELEKEMEEKEE